MIVGIWWLIKNRVSGGGFGCGYQRRDHVTSRVIGNMLQLDAVRVENSKYPLQA